jgi:hypothetical protein
MISMGKIGITGSVICAVCAVAIAATLILPRVAPTQFSGPNIGAGMVFLAAIGLGVVGLILLAVDVFRRRNRST